MSYIVKNPFFDKEEKIYYSKIGEPFPKENIKVDEKRLKELESNKNACKEPLIQEVEEIKKAEEAEEAEKAEEVEETEEAEEAEKVEEAEEVKEVEKAEKIKKTKIKNKM